MTAFAILATEPFNWNALVSLLGLIVTAWIAWRVEQRAKTAKEERETLKQVAATQETLVATVGEVKNTVVEVQEHTNGMHKEIMEVTARASKSEGKELERVEERQRVDEKAAAEKAPVVAGDPTEVTIVNTKTNPANVTTVKQP